MRSIVSQRKMDSSRKSKNLRNRQSTVVSSNLIQSDLTWSEMKYAHGYLLSETLKGFRCHLSLHFYMVFWRCKRVTDMQLKMSSASLNYKSNAFDSHGLSFQDVPRVLRVHMVYLLR